MKLALLVFSGILLPSCSSSGTARVHPEWRQRLEAVRTVVLASPEVILLTPDSEEEEQDVLDSEEIRALKEELLSIAAEALEEGGLAASPARVDDPRAERLQASYLRALEDLYRQRHDFEFPAGEEGTYRVSLGAVAGDIDPGLAGEAVLCVRVVGIKRSFGSWLGDTFTNAFASVGTSTLVDAALPVPGPPTRLHASAAPLRGCSTTVSLVERSTGALLWTDQEGSEGLSKSAVKSQLKRLVRRLSEDL